MKILVVTMQFPHFPAPGGEMRQYCLLREAAKKHEITLLTIGVPPNDTAESKLRMFVKEVIWFKWVPPSRGAVNPGIFRFLKGKPTLLQRYAERREIPDYLSGMKAGLFDIIQVEHSEIAHWVFGAPPEIPRILMMHNVNYLLYGRFAEVASGAGEKLKMMLESRNMKSYEASLAGKFNKLIAVSDDDRRHYLNIAPGADIEVVPNGVDTEYFSPGEDQPPEEDALVYTAQMGWKPSEDAVLWFCREIFAKLIRKYPNLKFYIVGKNPTDAVKALSGPNVIVTGFVEDVRPYVRKAKVYVVPLRIGGGTRLKILEAMAMCKPVVSTSVGAEGLRVNPPGDIVIADRPAEFEEAILTLLNNPRKREEMGKAGRMNVVQNYDWELIGKKMLDIYDSLKGSHAGPSVMNKHGSTT